MVHNFNDGEENPNNNGINHPNIPSGSWEIQMEGEGEAEQEQPNIKMKCVCKYPVVRIVVPASCERGPHSLADNVQHLGPHHVHLDNKSYK